MLVVDTDTLGGLPQRFVYFGRAVPPVRVSQSRRHGLEGLLRQAVRDAVHHSLEKEEPYKSKWENSARGLVDVVGGRGLKEQSL